MLRKCSFKSISDFLVAATVFRPSSWSDLLNILALRVVVYFYVFFFLARGLACSWFSERLEESPYHSTVLLDEGYSIPNRTICLVFYLLVSSAHWPNEASRWNLFYLILSEEMDFFNTLSFMHNFPHKVSFPYIFQHKIFFTHIFLHKIYFPYIFLHKISFTHIFLHNTSFIYIFLHEISFTYNFLQRISFTYIFYTNYFW